MRVVSARFALVIAFAVLILVLPSSASGAVPASLSFVSPADFDLSPDDSGETRVVTIRNGSDQPVTLTFTAVSDKGSVTVTPTTSTSLVPRGNPGAR